MLLKEGNATVSGAILMLAATAAFAGDMPSTIKSGDSKLGPVLTDASGMTLYYFDKDVSGKSNCNGKCAENWPPLVAADNATAIDDFTIIVRDDGGRQWAHKGKPLSLWVKDQKPGDTTGHRVRDVWTVATP